MFVDLLHSCPHQRYLGALFLTLSILACGCSGMSHEFLKTNADILDESIVGAVKEVGSVGIPHGSTIAIVEVTGGDCADLVPGGLVRDELIHLLRKQGFQVIDGRWDSASQWPAGSATQAATAHGTDLSMDQIAGLALSHMCEQRAGKTEPQQADYALVFRLLEVGVRYGRRDSDRHDTITRRGRTAFNYRIIDCRDAKVVDSGRADTFIDDSIPQDMKTLLAENLYSYYAHAHPLYELRPAPHTVPEKVELKSSQARSLRDAGIVFGWHRFTHQASKRFHEAAFSVGYEKQFRLFRGVDLAGQISVGASEERNDAQMYHIPVHLAGIYQHEIRGMQAFAGAGLCANYSYWTFPGMIYDAQSDKLIEDPEGGVWIVGPHLQAGIQAGHWRLTYRLQRGREKALGGDFANLHHEVSWDGYSVSLGYLP
jgi:hypothetical protein